MFNPIAATNQELADHLTALARSLDDGLLDIAAARLLDPRISCNCRPYHIIGCVARPEGYR